MTASSLANRPLRVGVTSGPTRAWVDPVRYVANASTGTLGSLIAERFCARGAEVDYVAGPGARVPADSESVRLHNIETPGDLNRTLEILSKADSDVPFDVWVHCMAVLDYEPDRVSDEKIPSGQDRLTLQLKPVPKAIGRFKELFQYALLVGFKLETDSDEAALREAARGLSRAAGCDLVVANASPFQDPEAHQAYFLESENDDWTGPFSGKERIAEGLVDWTYSRPAGHVSPKN